MLPRSNDQSYTLPVPQNTLPTYQQARHSLWQDTRVAIHSKLTRSINPAMLTSPGSSRPTKPRSFHATPANRVGILLLYKFRKLAVANLPV